jgi:hypothetical protein
VTLGSRRAAIVLLTAAFPLLVLPSFLGPSAAAPPLGVHSLLPSYDLGLHPAPGLVIALLVAGYLLAAAGTWQGLRAIRAGWVPSPRRVILVAALLVGITVLVPPFGSADHLSYVAYGRIKALEADPYVVVGVALLLLPQPGKRTWQAMPLWGLAGVAFALAAGTKLPYLAVAAAAWWAVHWRPARELAAMTISALAGAALVLFPAHSWAGPHVYDQTRVAGHMVSIASP